jgi:hypothetical protein
LTKLGKDAYRTTIYGDFTTLNLEDNRKIYKIERQMYTLGGDYKSYGIVNCKGFIGHSRDHSKAVVKVVIDGVLP